MWKKRTLAMLALIQLGLLLLVGRLAQIQLIDAESFANHNLIAESVASDIFICVCMMVVRNIQRDANGEYMPSGRLGRR
ncbi:hypothetical protein [Geobacillus sp. ZGt-1]|uniref:hypothetical protein n=1 Tax=Geobacillus sp. ZGt-1 TaxID=1631556 RepID=UPI00064A8526|nr:hypothetical protein [Geobacillus sp. ZGt-1]